MISALADAGAVLDRDDYLEAASRCAAFVLSSMRADDGRLLRTWKDGPGGRAHIAGYLEDHAFMLQALLVLYEASFDERWYLEAVRDRRADARALRRSRRRRLLHDRERPGNSGRPRQGHAGRPDSLGQLGRGARPAASRAAVGRRSLRTRAQAAWWSCTARSPPAIRRRSATCCRRSTFSWRRRARSRSSLRAGRMTVRARWPASSDIGFAHMRCWPEGRAISARVPLLEGRRPVDGRAAAYVCERFACQAPITDSTPSGRTAVATSPARRRLDACASVLRRCPDVWCTRTPRSASSARLKGLALSRTGR